MKIKRGNKTIGNYNEDTNTFTKTVKQSVHMFKKMNAWGIDGELFTKTLLPNNALIVLHDCENDGWYSINAEDMNELGAWLEFQPYGKQIFLETKQWNSPK